MRVVQVSKFCTVLLPNPVRESSLIRSLDTKLKNAVRSSARKLKLKQAHFLWKVYYLHDAVTGKLLYIGKSKNPFRRKSQFEKLYSIKTTLGLCQRFVYARDVRSAEAKAIHRHKPPYNISENVKNKKTSIKALGANEKYLKGGH